MGSIITVAVSLTNPIKEYADRYALLNKLNNGGFVNTPYDYSAYEYDTYLAYSSSTRVKRLTWFKSRQLKGATLSNIVTTELVPGWSISCDVDEGASIEYNPTNVDGYTIWSRDGGKVLGIKFNSDCKVTLYQDVHYFNEFYLQDYTAAYSGYSISGQPEVRLLVDSGTAVEGLGTVLGNSFRNYRRVVYNEQYPGDGTKLQIKVEISGKEGESVGIGGFVFCLGEYSIECPWVDNQTYYEFPSGAIIFTDDECPQGFKALGYDMFFIQTYGDATSLDNLPPKGLLDYNTNYSPQMVTGNDNHNAHSLQNSFVVGELQWLSDNALGCLRIKSPDFNDRGLIDSAGTAYDRDPDVWWFTWTWATLKFSNWSAFNLPPFSSGAITPPFPDDSDLQINEFSRTSRMGVFLPASAGRVSPAAPSSNPAATYMDNRQHEHKHLLQPDLTKFALPEYKVRLACIKL